MKKFIITCDTKWCGTEKQFRALAEAEFDLDDLAENLAFDNYTDYFDGQDILDDLGYGIDDLSEEEIDDIMENLDESEYYWFSIEECVDEEEWNSFGNSYIYEANNKENE